MGVKGNFSRMSSVMVYKYEYNEELWEHGGVKVTFKERLSYQAPHGREAEWSPIVSQVRHENGPNGERMQVEANVTDPKGVMYMRKPPDLRKEPPREALDPDKLLGIAAQCKRILTVRDDDLSPSSKAFWQGFGNFLEPIHMAERVPQLPHTFTCQHEACAETFPFTLNGSPCPLIPILRA